MFIIFFVAILIFTKDIRLSKSNVLNIFRLNPDIYMKIAREEMSNSVAHIFPGTIMDFFRSMKFTTLWHSMTFMFTFYVYVTLWLLLQCHLFMFRLHYVIFTTVCHSWNLLLYQHEFINFISFVLVGTSTTMLSRHKLSPKIFSLTNQPIKMAENISEKTIVSSIHHIFPQVDSKKMPHQWF